MKHTTTSSKPILQGFSNFLTDEKKRGMLTSIVNGTLITVLNYIGVVVLGLSAPKSTLIFMYMIGSVTGYSLDIIFAKSEFAKLSLVDGLTGGAAEKIPYGDLRRRLQWLLRSYPNAPFQKFLVASVIETLTSISLLRAIIIAMDSKVILPGNVRWRNFITAVVVSVVVFILFGNMLRFDWAYSNVENPLMNISVLMWMALSVLIFSLVYTVVNEIGKARCAAKSTGSSDDIFSEASAPPTAESAS
jgi:hypothetical protein